MIAHYITSEIVPRSDLHVDLHSGGKTLEYIPCVFVPHGATREARQQALDAALSFGTDLAITQDDSFPDSGRFLSAMFSCQGKPAYTYELAGAGRVSPGVVKMAEHGVRNIMQHIGILQGHPLSNEAQGREATRLVTVPHSDCYIAAPDDGLYEPFIELGDQLTAGQEIGQVHYPQHHQKEPWKVITKQAGFLLCKRPPGKVQRGDNIAIIAAAQP